MHYVATLTVPALTSATSPVASTLRLERGVLVRSLIQFSPGCAGLVYIRALQGAHQWLPVSAHQWLYGDDEIIAIPDELPVDKQPYEVTVHGYSDDDLYAHNVTVHIDILRTGPGVGVQSGVVDRLRDLLRSGR